MRKFWMVAVLAALTVAMSAANADARGRLFGGRMRTRQATSSCGSGGGSASYGGQMMSGGGCSSGSCR